MLQEGLKKKLIIITKNALIIFAIIVGLAGCNALRSPLQTDVSFPVSPPNRDGLIWKLVWSDEFDYEGLPDPSKWSHEIGYVRNNELQYYTESRFENVKVENGLLIIETKKRILQWI